MSKCPCLAHQVITRNTINMAYTYVLIFSALLPLLTFAQTYTASFTEYGGCNSTS